MSDDLNSSNAERSASNTEATPIVVDVNHATVAYRSYKERPTSLKESSIRFLRTGRIRHYETFNALDDVTFQLPKGEVLGIIGSNGSGKSTMLKVLSGVLKPTQGYVKTTGTLSSLIELGVGFDPELNAVENIFLNGSLYRRTREEMEERVGSILDFAELEEFKTTPIKYYSSGMLARLGFATAIDIDPEVLLVDEVLAVGDERFVQKCNKVFERFFQSDKTIIMVSHQLNMLKIQAHKIALLSRGQLVYLGDPATAIEMYLDKSYETALGARHE